MKAPARGLRRYLMVLAALVVVALPTVACSNDQLGAGTAVGPVAAPAWKADAPRVPHSKFRSSFVKFPMVLENQYPPYF